MRIHACAALPVAVVKLRVDLCRHIAATASAAEQQRRPLIKICGVTSEADATMAAEAGADFVGESLASAYRP